MLTCAGSVCAEASTGGRPVLSGSAVLEMSACWLHVRVTSEVAALNAEPAVRCSGCATGTAACATIINSKAKAMNRHGPCTHRLQITIAATVTRGTEFASPRKAGA